MSDDQHVVPHVEAIDVALLDVINSIQDASGRPRCIYRAELCPLLEVEGFDSLNGIETGAALSARFGVEFGENPLKDPESGRARTLAQTVQALAAKLMDSR